MKTFLAINRTDSTKRTAPAGRRVHGRRAYGWRSAMALMLALGMSILIGCGGGGSTSVAGVGSGGTGSYTSGSISGFGSIIVNGIHYDESAASAAGAIQNEDGIVGNSASLKLGMVVNIIGSAVNTSSIPPSAKATSVSFSSELVGSVESINLTSKTFVVLGRTVAITGSSFFDDSLAGGLAALKVSDVVEVYGFYDPASNTVSATRIERSGAADLKLSGTVSNLNAASQSFSIGSRTVSFANIPPASQVPALSNGQLVRVKATGTLTPTGLLNATRIAVQGLGGSGSSGGGSSGAGGIGAGDRDDASVEGVVNAFTSAGAFSVNGVVVDARNAVVSGGAAIALGVRVEVVGSTIGNVLVARKVSVKTNSDIDTDEFEVTGTVGNLNASAKTMVVRGVTVSYGGVVRYDDGVEADLARTPAPRVEVKGVRAPGGTALQAQRIKFLK